MRGIDISWYNGWPFNNNTKQGYEESDFVIIKSTQGQSYAQTQYFKKAIGKVLNDNKLGGAYHYLDGSGVKKEANYFISVVKPYLGDIILAADYESGMNKAWGNGEYAKQFMDQVYRLTGVRCFLYTNSTGVKHCSSSYPNYKLWFAGYPEGKHSWSIPTFPSRYTTGAWPKYDIWQFTSGSGKLDRNITSLTKTDWLNLAKGSNSKKITTSTTNKTSGGTTKVSVNFNNYYNKLSNSGQDQHGGIHGGAAGDQTGKEWNIISWYNRPWKCVLRYPKQQVRELIAELGIEAANNSKIGYDQYQRQTYWSQLQAVGYRPSKITTACEADCSAGVIANTKAVGHLLNIPALKNLSATYTGNMRSAYKTAGFEILTDSKYLTSSAYLLPGDILLNDGAHTATNLGIGSKVNYTQNSTTVSKSSSIGENNTTTKTSEIQTMLNKVGNYGLAVDNSYGAATTKAVKDFQKKYGLIVDGNVGQQTLSKLKELTAGAGSKTTQTKTKTPSKAKTIKINTTGKYSKTVQCQGEVIVSLLNVRSGPGMNYKNITSYPTIKKDKEIGVCDAVKNGSSVWYYVKIDGKKGSKYGFVSSTYIKLI